MNKCLVSIVRYIQPLTSVRRAVELSNGLGNLQAGARIFIKPNIVFWSRMTPFPKWGVITTSRVVEDMVVLLKEMGAGAITIGEGTVVMNPKDIQTAEHAFEALGYGILKKRYGIRSVNIFKRPFKKVDLGDGVVLKINSDILESDFIVNLPVLKTHVQTIVSLGIKNLKGTLDIPSRKKFHNADSGRDLHFMIAKLADRMPPMFTLLDGIFTNERGPAFDGRIRRSNILIASRDILAADFVGASVLGYEPAMIPHLVHAAKNRQRPCDLSGIVVAGEPIAAVRVPHEYGFPYTKDGTLPIAMKKMGIQGLSYKKYDLTMCTYCSIVNRAIPRAIANAWNGTPWDDVEILTGKVMRPTPGKNKTVLVGKCIYQASKDNPHIREMFAVKSCPPRPKAIVKALHRAGIMVDPATFENIEKMPGFFLTRYQDKPEFEESFFKIK